MWKADYLAVQMPRRMTSSLPVARVIACTEHAFRTSKLEPEGLLS